MGIGRLAQAVLKGTIEREMRAVSLTKEEKEKGGAVRILTRNWHGQVPNRVPGGVRDILLQSK